MVEFSQILQKLSSNWIKFDQNGRIRPNSTFEFGIWNSKFRNWNEFERIRPSLIWCNMSHNFEQFCITKLQGAEAKTGINFKLILGFQNIIYV